MLYEGYFPKFVGVSALEESSLRTKWELIEAVLSYLGDKDYVMSKEGGWRITAKGIDFLEDESLI